MRGLRSTIALLAVLLGLGGYIYFVVSKAPTETETKQEKLFGQLDSSAIAELKVKSASGDVTTLKKVDDAWRIVAPIDAMAAATDATAIASAIAELEVARVVEEAPTDVKEYGLDAPRIEVDFKSADGKTAGRLLIGERTATGGNLYARKDGQPRVVLVGQFLDETFNKGTFDLRDKSIIRTDRSKVDGLDLNIEGKAMEFVKTGTDWRLTRPVEARADFATVEGLIGQVESLQMKSVVTSTATAADAKKYGFERPQAAISIHLGGARATLLVGNQAEGETVYAKDASKPDIYTIDRTAANDLKKPVEDYRRRDLFDFRAFNATRIEFTRNGQITTLERVKAKEANSPDTWHRSSPTEGNPDREKVEGLLARLADTRATAFAAPGEQTSLNRPVLTVVVKFDEGRKEERVIFGRNGSAVFASRPDDLGAAHVDAAQFDEAIKALDEIVK